MLRLVVDQLGISLIEVGIPRAGRLLEVGNRLGRPEMPLAILAEPVVSTRRQHRRRALGHVIGFAIPGSRLGGDFLQSDPPHP